MTIARPKPKPEGVAVKHLDGQRHAVSLDGIVRWVGSRDECERRARIFADALAPSDRDSAAQALWRLSGR
jgi:hypothetical protein